MKDCGGGGGVQQISEAQKQLKREEKRGEKIPKAMDLHFSKKNNNNDTGCATPFAIFTPNERNKGKGILSICHYLVYYHGVLLLHCEKNLTILKKESGPIWFQFLHLHSHAITKYLVKLLRHLLLNNLTK